ncbi:DHA2 family efflux MFS transporter permease subunit [Streptomyces neyagawaensis]|uniref:DHA2 family efflux MFS transporter permease subunit n=1 Tax=Streptomyces neyagawaensis TaxID=42238 RepID=A0ABV3B503_9ACTN
MRKWAPLLAVGLGTFMLIMDVTITLVALPDISTSLHTSLDALAWVIDGYALALAAALLAIGTLADRWGQRRVYLAGLAVFTIASLICGLAHTPALLITMRVVQGVGAAGMFATSVSLLRHTYQGRDYGIAMGVWGAIASGAAALGPLAGGILTQGLGWGWIFFVNVPIGIAALVLTVRVVPKPINRPGGALPNLDVAGMLLFALFASSLLYGTIRSHASGWTGSQTLIAFGVCALALLAFVLRQRATDHPMFDLALLRRPAFTAALVAMFVGEFTAYGFMAYTSIWLQSLTGLSPLGTGLIMLPSSAASMIVSLMAGRRLRHYLPRYSLPVALLLVAVGALAQAGLTPGSTGSRVIAGLFIGGLGMGMVFPVATTLAIESVPHRRAGMAAGAFTTFQQLGYAVGVAVFASVMTASAKSELTGHVTDARATAQELTGGGAQAITAQAPVTARPALEHLLSTAFVHGLNTVAVIGAALAAVTALITGFVLRRETWAAAHYAEPDDEETNALVNT